MVFQLTEVRASVVILTEALAARVLGYHGVTDGAPLSRSVTETVGNDASGGKSAIVINQSQSITKEPLSTVCMDVSKGDSLWRVDPYNIQVTEVHALLVQERSAGASFGPHMAHRGLRGGSGCLTSRS